MGKRVVVISTSLRAQSNSDALAREFARGASDAGHSVELIELGGKRIAFCTGCLACQSSGACVIDDDADAIAESVLAADVVAFATPIYYFEMSGQMKTLIDRMNSMYPKDHRFRDVYLLATAAEEGDEVFERCERGLGGWIACYEPARLAGSLYCGGIDAPGSIAGSAHLADAYEMGRKV